MWGYTGQILCGQYPVSLLYIGLTCSCNARLKVSSLLVPSLEVLLEVHPAAQVVGPLDAPPPTLRAKSNLQAYGMQLNPHHVHTVCRDCKCRSNAGRTPAICNQLGVVQVLAAGLLSTEGWHASD
mgnify:CR=1 FL=1